MSRNKISKPRSCRFTLDFEVTDDPKIRSSQQLFDAIEQLLAKHESVKIVSHRNTDLVDVVGRLRDFVDLLSRISEEGRGEDAPFRDWIEELNELIAAAEAILTPSARKRGGR
jgi:hypothetical protein